MKFKYIALIFLLSGCDTLASISERSSAKTNITEVKTDPPIKTPTSLVVKPVSTTPLLKEDPLKVSKRLWLGNKTLLKTPTDPLPTLLEKPRAVKILISKPQVLSVVLGRLEAKILNLPISFPNKSTLKTAQQSIVFEIEERAPRHEGKRVKLPKAKTLKVNWDGPLSGLLDGISEKTGYRWHYADKKKTITFYRYHDQEYADNQPKAQNNWVVDPTKHQTLRQVLMAWATESGWSLTWSKDLPNYTIGATASFKGTFTEAVTTLAETNSTIAPIVPWFYYENKQLVIRPAKEEKS